MKGQYPQFDLPKEGEREVGGGEETKTPKQIKATPGRMKAKVHKLVEGPAMYDTSYIADHIFAVERAERESGLLWYHDDLFTNAGCQECDEVDGCAVEAVFCPDGHRGIPRVGSTRAGSPAPPRTQAAGPKPRANSPRISRLPS